MRARAPKGGGEGGCGNLPGWNEGGGGGVGGGRLACKGGGRFFEDAGRVTPGAKNAMGSCFGAGARLWRMGRGFFILRAPPGHQGTGGGFSGGEEGQGRFCADLVAIGPGGGTQG